MDTRRRDDGMVLPLVLVLILLGALIIVPLMSYSISVFKANRVLTDRTQQIEAVKGATRVALGDPVRLFNECTSGTPVDLGPAGLDLSVTTTCQQTSQVSVIDAVEVPYGAAALQVGEAVPPSFVGSTIDSTGETDPVADDWWDAYDAAAPTVNTIWLPNLPERFGDIRESTPFEMPGAFDCDVYFPGTYLAPVVVSDRTYFASGVYYFEDTVHFVGGADAVVGFGLEDGCTSDQEAVFEVMTPPARFNIEGLGATFVLGDDARLIVDNGSTTDAVGDLVSNDAGLPLSVRFNQRYLENEGDAGARVSIVSVNGKLDEGPPESSGPLVVPDVIAMPLSSVQTSEGLVSATDSTQALRPSTLTAEPRPPLPPVVTGATPLIDDKPPDASRPGAVRISWDAPDPQAEGGSTITRYVVDTDLGVQTCETAGALACVVRGLDLDVDHEFTVVAENSAGLSDPSAPIDARVEIDEEDRLTVPDAPLDVVASEEHTDATVLTWDTVDGAATGNAEIDRYSIIVKRVFERYEVPLEDPPQDPLPAVVVDEEVVVIDAAQTSCPTEAFREQSPATECIIEGLPTLVGPTLETDGYANLGYSFEVVAENVVGESSPSTPTVPILAFTGPEELPPRPEPFVTPVAARYVPLPIVDVDLSDPSHARVDVQGYIAIPQGRLSVVNPGAGPEHAVSLTGGVVAGSMFVDELSAGVPESTIGFENTVLQRTIRLRATTGSGRVTSTAVIQINESGVDYAINSWVVQ